MHATGLGLSWKLAPLWRLQINEIPGSIQGPFVLLANERSGFISGKLFQYPSLSNSIDFPNSGLQDLTYILAAFNIIPEYVSTKLIERL